VADEMLIQVSYAIGVAKPLSIYANSYGTARAGLSDSQIAARIGELFDLRPAKIVEKFGLDNPIYEPTAAYGHMGRKPFTRKVKLRRGGREEEREVRFFAWEELDAVPAIRDAFGI
ncbi:MAG: methionine adenosyltransferase domain-containing protein, partial [Bacteroidales bacterium]|nr:methionine adenosyltransferase domain-containing protein [Bacteroidales bacterium]